MRSLKKEIVRKIIHVSGLIYIPTLILLGKKLIAFTIIAITLLVILFEIKQKRKGTAIDQLLREYEQTRIPSYIFTGIAFSIITPFFSVDACIISAITAFAGDGVAGIAKRLKSELAFPAFILPCLILIFLLSMNLVPAILSMIISSIFDGRKWEDNFTIPVSAAIVYETLEFILQM